MLHPFGSEYAESPRWNSFERLYIRFFGQVDLPTRMRARLIRKAVRRVSWKTMLDFGSGAGAYSFYFSRFSNVQVWGMDTDPSRVLECTAINRTLKRKSVSFVRGSSILENFQPDSMDVVLAVEILHHLPDLRKGLVEIQRVLKPGGHLIGHIPLAGHKGKTTTALFDTERFVSLLKEAGFEPVSITRVFGGPARLLALAFSHCMSSRLITAILFPMLLLASLLLAGESLGGTFCIAAARKK